MTNNEQNTENRHEVEWLMRKITEQCPNAAYARRAQALAMDVVTHYGKINLDAEDVNLILDSPGTFAAFDVVIDDDCPNRGDELVSQLTSQTAGFGKINSILFCLFCPDKRQLEFGDIQPFSEWLQNHPGSDIVWGTAIDNQSPTSLRAVVLLKHD